MPARVYILAPTLTVSPKHIPYVNVLLPLGKSVIVVITVLSHAPPLERVVVNTPPVVYVVLPTTIDLPLQRLKLCLKIGTVSNTNILVSILSHPNEFLSVSL